MYVGGSVSDCTCCHPQLCALSWLVTSHQAGSADTHSWVVFQINTGRTWTSTVGRDWYFAAVLCQDFSLLFCKARFFCLSDAFKYWANHMLPQRESPYTSTRPPPPSLWAFYYLSRFLSIHFILVLPFVFWCQALPLSLCAAGQLSTFLGQVFQYTVILTGKIRLGYSRFLWKNYCNYMKKNQHCHNIL